MSPAHLNLFPAAATSTGMPHKSSLRKIQTNNIPNANGEVKLNGVAFQVISPHKTPAIEPVAVTIKHSLFCEPLSAGGKSSSPASVTTTSASSTTGPLQRKSRTRRPSSQLFSEPYSDAGDFSPRDGDQLTALPSNTLFGSTSLPKRSLSSHLQRSKPMKTIAVSIAGNDASTPIADDDTLSPLPSKTRFQPASPSLPGYSPPMKSMFPRYDTSRPLDRQQYYPTARAPSPATFDSSKTSKIASPTERHFLKKHDSAVGLVNGYEHIPAAGHADLEAVYKASCEDFPCEGRKVQLGLHQPTDGVALAIGTSAEDLIYSMDTEEHPDLSSSPVPNLFTVKKHSATSASSSQVAQLGVPEHTTGVTPNKDHSTTIFPQAAALAAIASVSNSPQAQSIAAFDPTASSPEAARMAQDAVAVAFSRYCCDLVQRSRQADNFGAVTAHYDLQHPMLGTCAVTVTKSYAPGSMSCPRAKISFHHPSATPAAVEADTLNLAFLDFANDACVLDVPGLLALDTRWVIDTVITALLAVAVIENDTLVKEATTFAPPPKAAVSVLKGKKGDGAGGEAKRRIKRSASKREKKEKAAQVNDEDELPVLARATVKVAGFGLKAAVWVVGTGVKVGVKVAIGVGKAVIK